MTVSVAASMPAAASLPSCTPMLECTPVVHAPGTNNLGLGGHGPTETANGVLEVVVQLLRRTKARVLLSSLLPRGPRRGRDGVSHLYGERIRIVNRQLRQQVGRLRPEPLEVGSDGI
jgi:hypothetical protein